jgi:hypothetical protein
MNVASIKSKAYRLTNRNSTTFLNGVAADILSEINTQYGLRILDILKVQVDRNSSQNEATTDLLSTSGLTAGQLGFNGEYPFPTDLLKPIRVEVSYDGTTWYPTSYYDVYENTGSEHSEDSINSTFSQSNPFVRFDRNSYFVRPLKTTADDVTDGIHIWYEQRQTDLTTDSPVFESNLHDILAYDLALQEYLMHPALYTNNWKLAFDIERNRVENKFLEFYKNRFKKSMQLRVEYADTNNDYT